MTAIDMSEDSYGNSISDLLKELDREKARILISKVTRKYNKPVTVVSGLEDMLEAESMSKELKKVIGTGGTYKDGKILLQGDHRDRVKEYLVAKGFHKEAIEVL